MAKWFAGFSQDPVNVWLIDTDNVMMSLWQKQELKHQSVHVAIVNQGGL